ncbi:hypothetical protein H5U35_07850 [Candidatus Aerophobetes bacterium]|nr:hypothetical protein [Candidatus Aerophobetes bacterium]
MREVLLPQTKIGEFLSLGVEMEGDEVGLYIASADVSASCAFKFDEWKNFVEGVNRANEKFEILQKKKITGN